MVTVQGLKNTVQKNQRPKRVEGLWFFGALVLAFRLCFCFLTEPNSELTFWDAFRVKGSGFSISAAVIRGLYVVLLCLGRESNLNQRGLAARASRDSSACRAAGMFGQANQSAFGL